ncbi:MAG: hypothetical protein LIP77_11155 [Planctomycetes bacterium]|nr:hypothetical protein [Planctomycetota bacterium]
MPIPRIAAVFALCIILSGCSDRGNRSTRTVDESANPDLLVKNAVETRTSLSSIAGKGVMRIVDQPNRFGLTVNADVVADESNRLRIRADKLAGAIQAFDVVMLQDDIGFYIPTQNTLYHGKVEDLQYFSFRFDPDEVLRQMLRPETSLLLKKWRNSPNLPGDPANAIMVEEDAPANQPRLRLAINKRNGMIASVTQLDRNNQPVLVKRYDDYRDLSRSRRSTRMADDDSAFPYLISFTWPRDKRMMEMHFKTVEGNAMVIDEDFEVATSSDTRYLPLTEAQMDPSMGDEPLAELPRAGPAERPL